MLEPVRVLLADDDPLARRAISSILSSTEDIVVVAEVGDGDEVVAAVRERAVDVVLMDLRMPRMDGVNATAAVGRLPRPPQVIVLTSWDVNDAVMRSMRAGAAGFLVKTAAPEEIIAAVRHVAAGDAVLSPHSTRELLDYLARSYADDERDQAAALMETLSERERDVAAAVSVGLTNSAIAEKLYLSVATVKTHLAAVQTKLGVENRVGVAVLADRARLRR